MLVSYGPRQLVVCMYVACCVCLFVCLMKMSMSLDDSSMFLLISVHACVWWQSTPQHGRGQAVALVARPVHMHVAAGRSHICTCVAHRNIVAGEELHRVKVLPWFNYTVPRHDLHEDQRNMSLSKRGNCAGCVCVPCHTLPYHTIPCPLCDVRLHPF